jgi:hypothetical protein
MATGKHQVSTRRFSMARQCAEQSPMKAAIEAGSIVVGLADQRMLNTIGTVSVSEPLYSDGGGGNGSTRCTRASASASSAA